MGFDNLKFMCGAKYKEDIFASCLQFNGLFRINSETGERKFIGSFPQESLEKEKLHRNAFLIGQNIIFVPYMAQNIHIYDIGTNEFYVFDLDRGNYVNGYIGEKIEDIIYLVPEMRGGDIIAFDVHKKMTQVVMNSKELERSIGNQAKKELLFYRICSKDNHLFLPLQDSNIILEISVFTKEVFTHTLEQVKLWGGFKGKKGIWVLGNRGNEIYFWDNEKNKIKKINCEILNHQNKRNINWIVDMGEFVYALPAWSEYIYEVRDEQLIKLDFYKKEQNAVQTFYAPIEENEIVYLLPFGESDLFKIRNRVITRTQIEKLDTHSRLYCDIVRANLNNIQMDVWEENVKFSLEQYIDMLMGEDADLE